MDDPDAPAADAAPSQRLFNRELSWLDFNERVLALAEDTALPLLERVKFLAIFSSNLDEFFQVRVAGLKAQVEAGVATQSPDGRTPSEQLAAIRARVVDLIAQQEDAFSKRLKPELAEHGIHVVDWASLGAADREHLGRVFEEQIFAVLTPLSVDPAHPFPYISNLSLNLAVVIRDPAAETNRFARLKVPPLLPRFLQLPDGARLIRVEEVIAAHLGALFPGMEIVGHYGFRVTRDAELDFDEGEADDLLRAIESNLHRRLRMNDAVRLEVHESMSADIRELLVRELELGPEDAYVHRSALDHGALWEICELERPDLKDRPWVPVTPTRLSGIDEGDGWDVFAALREGDVLVHHPYDSFKNSVEAFLTQAARDPHVLAIKHTLYRTSGPENPIVRALIRAAQSGKEVVALIELKARFDEESNIEWARSLEEAGVHVVYGLVGLKTHGKVALVVRREPSGIRRYCHLGTGNYNPLTANLYEDVGILTASPELGADVAQLFNHLTGCSRPSGYQKLLVAPASLRPSLRELIRAEAEAGEAGRIVLKVNSLSDTEMIEALYAASGAGVDIDLIVRGICCLRPGVPGLSERIRVRSILGRFLEHSRIFRFGSDARGPRYYIGSADLMSRNLDRRVEVATPVEDPELARRLEAVLRVNLDPEARAWELGPDWKWRRTQVAAGGFHSQERFQELARARAHDDPPHGAGT